LGREIYKSGVGTVLPAFLQKTEKYPAFISNAKGKIVTCNDFFKKICSTLTCKTFYVKDIFSASGLTAFNANADLLSTKQPVAFETNINNHTISWELSAFEEGERLVLCVGSILFTKPDANINLEKNHFSAFMNNSPALMWATDMAGRIVIMNKKYQEQTGFSEDDLGKLLWDVFPRELAEQFKRNDEVVIKQNGLMEMEEVSLDKFGRKREYIVYKFPLQTADYGLVVAGCSVDITEHKNANKKLVHQNNRFRQIARLQSHAVRRPLANILGLIDLIEYYASKNNFSEITSMIALLKDSSNDLDKIIRKIVNKAGIFNTELQPGL